MENEVFLLCFLSGTFSGVSCNKSNDKWLENFDDAPAFENCIRLEYNGRKFLLLNGAYEWLDRKKLSFETYDLPCKTCGSK